MSKLHQYRLLGRSGLRVSPLCLGTMTFGTEWGWGSDESASRAILDRYLDAGGNFLDTANFYTGGTSEKMLGKFLEGRRDHVVLATKFSLTMRPGDANAAGNGRKNIVQSCEASLKRLGTDYIDLYILHAWDQLTPEEEWMSAFDTLVRQGKILHVGLSDIPAWKAARAQTLAEWRGWERVCAMQIEYSLIQRDVERDLVPMSRELGMGVTPWSPLASGFLSGKFSRENLAPAGEPRLKDEALKKKASERNLAILDVLHAVAKETGKSCAQVALNWVQNKPGVASTIIGARRMEQLEDNLAALDFDLDADQLRRLDEASAIELGFPHDFLRGPRVKEILHSGKDIVA